MADLPDRPLLNPVLTLTLPPTAERPEIVIKKKEQIVEERLDTQRLALASQIESLLRSRSALRLFAGSLLLVIDMFPDSLAVTHTPRDLFRGKLGTRLLGAAPKGYLAEIHIDDLVELAQTIRSSTTIGHRCDVSRIESIRAFTPADALRRPSADTWKQAARLGSGRGIIVWLAPFRTASARAAVIDCFNTLAGTSLLPTFPRLRFAPPNDDPTGEPVTLPVEVPNQSSLAIAYRDLVATGHARAIIEVPRQAALDSLAASGGAFRIDPVQNITVAKPGIGQEPGPLPADITVQPIVAMVDGGRTARRYCPDLQI